MNRVFRRIRRFNLFRVGLHLLKFFGLFWLGVGENLAWGRTAWGRRRKGAEERKSLWDMHALIVALARFAAQ